MVRILVATDFSEENRPVLDYAAHMVQQCGGKLYLLHAVEPCMIDAAGTLGEADLSSFMPGTETTFRAEASECAQVLALADARAKQLGNELRERWSIPIYAKAEEADDIVDCVSDFCTRHNVDNLVIGNRHHSLLTSILLGNTAEKLMRAARIPVTIVPCGPQAK